MTKEQGRKIENNIDGKREALLFKFIFICFTFIFIFMPFEQRLKRSRPISQFKISNKQWLLANQICFLVLS